MPKLADLPADVAQQFHAYCNNTDQVIADAIADGLKGEKYNHYVSIKGRFTGKVIVKYKPLNNLELYQYAKRRFGID